MAQIIVRNLDDTVVDRLKARAGITIVPWRQRSGRSWSNRPRWTWPKLADSYDIRERLKLQGESFPMSQSLSARIEIDDNCN